MSMNKNPVIEAWEYRISGAVINTAVDIILILWLTWVVLRPTGFQFVPIKLVR